MEYYNYYDLYKQQTDLINDPINKVYADYIDVYVQNFSICPFCKTQQIKKKIETSGEVSMTCENKSCKWSVVIAPIVYVNLHKEKKMLESEKELTRNAIMNVLRENFEQPYDEDKLGSESAFNALKKKLLVIETGLESINKIFDEFNGEESALKVKKFNNYQKIYLVQQQRKNEYYSETCIDPLIKKQLFEIYKNEYPFKSAKRTSEIAKQVGLDEQIIKKWMNWYSYAQEYLVISEQNNVVERDILILKKQFKRQARQMIVKLPKINEVKSLIKIPKSKTKENKQEQDSVVVD